MAVSGPARTWRRSGSSSSFPYWMTRGGNSTGAVRSRLMNHSRASTDDGSAASYGSSGRNVRVGQPSVSRCAVERFLKTLGGRAHVRTHRSLSCLGVTGAHGFENRNMLGIRDVTVAFSRYASDPRSQQRLDAGQDVPQRGVARCLSQTKMKFDVGVDKSRGVASFVRLALHAAENEGEIFDVVVSASQGS